MLIRSQSAYCFASFVLFVLLAVSSACGSEYRTWTDSTGKHKLRAKLESVKGGTVILVRESGQKVKIPLKKLSNADQDYIAQQDIGSPFENVEGSDEAAGKPTEKSTDKSPEKSAEESDEAAEGPRKVKVDWTQSRAVLFSATDSEWHVAVPAAAPADYRARSVPLPPKTDFFEGLTGMAVSRVAKTAAVSYALDRLGQKTMRLLLCDLQTGRVTASASVKGDNMMVLALHDDGRQVLMRSNEFAPQNQNRLEIWTIKGKSVSRSLVWTPYEGTWEPDQQVIWAEFLDAKRVATCNRSGKLAIWDLATGQPICHVEAAGEFIPALSSDRKLIAIAAKDMIGLLDVDKQEIVAAKETPHDLGGPMLAFSPSGNKLACIAGDRIVVWETATGKVEKDFTLPGLWIHGAIDFPDDGFLLANRQFLIELENQIKLWHYAGAENTCTLAGTTFFALSGNERGGLLLAAKLPHAEAADMLKKALKQPDLFVFHKGTTVKLDVAGIPDPAERTKAEESLTKKLQDLNCSVDPSAEVEVVAWIEGPKARDVSYMHSGTYHVQEYFTHLKFAYHGQALWETNCTNIPFITFLKKGENMEGKLREASAKPAYGLYTDVTLPEFLQKPSEKGNAGAEQTLGVSELNEHGLRSRPNQSGVHFKRRK